MDVGGTAVLGVGIDRGVGTEKVLRHGGERRGDGMDTDTKEWGVAGMVSLTRTGCGGGMELTKHTWGGMAGAQGSLSMLLARECRWC